MKCSQIFSRCWARVTAAVVLLILLLVGTVDSLPVRFATTGTPLAGGDNCTWTAPLPAERRHVGGLRAPDAKHVVFFSDGTNFDDVVTLLYLTKETRGKLLAVYLQGNGWANIGPAVQNFYNLLHMMGDEFRNVPVLAGSYHALADEERAAAQGGNPEYSYRFSVPAGPSGLLDSDTMLGLAAQLPVGPNRYNPFVSPDEDSESIPALLDLMEALPAGEKVEFLVTGTFTPLAKMFAVTYASRVKGILPRINSVYVMGGAVYANGNLFSVPENSRAEFNLYLDPHATRYAIGNFSQRNIRVVLVPLDATNDVPLQLRMLLSLRDSPRTPEAHYTGRLMDRLRLTWFDVGNFFNTAYLWDPSAAIAMFYPNVVQNSRVTYIRVVTDEGPRGPNQGRTQACSYSEVKAGVCSRIVVVDDLLPDEVTDRLLEALQNDTNSAQRAPACFESS